MRWTLAPASRITGAIRGRFARRRARRSRSSGASIHAEVVPRAASEGLVEAFAVEVERTRVAVHGTAFSVSRTESGHRRRRRARHGRRRPRGHVGATTGHLLVGPSRADVLARRRPHRAAPRARARAGRSGDRRRRRAHRRAAPAGAIAVVDAQEPVPALLGVHACCPGAPRRRRDRGSGRAAAPPRRPPSPRPPPRRLRSTRW